MNQLNPLHVGALLLVLLIFSFVKLHEVKGELQTVQHHYKESEKLAVKLKSLKNVYANKKKTKRSLERILKQPSLRKADLQVEKTKTHIIIKSASLHTRELNSLMGKVLNGNYNIVELKIKKLNETDASLYMEIQW